MSSLLTKTVPPVEVTDCVYQASAPGNDKERALRLYV
jgi:hypothetical protein